MVPPEKNRLLDDIEHQQNRGGVFKQFTARGNPHNTVTLTSRVESKVAAISGIIHTNQSRL